MQDRSISDIQATGHLLYESRYEPFTHQESTPAKRDPSWSARSLESEHQPHINHNEPLSGMKHFDPYLNPKNLSSYSGLAGAVQPLPARRSSQDAPAYYPKGSPEACVPVAQTSPRELPKDWRGGKASIPLARVPLLDYKSDVILPSSRICFDVCNSDRKGITLIEALFENPKINGMNDPVIQVAGNANDHLRVACTPYVFISIMWPAYQQTLCKKIVPYTGPQKEPITRINLLRQLAASMYAFFQELEKKKEPASDLYKTWSLGFCPFEQKRNVLVEIVITSIVFQPVRGFWVPELYIASRPSRT